jgi:uncharacterized protein (DUF697 family)
MPNLLDVGNIFTTMREVDLNAIRDQAEEPLRVLVLGSAGVGKSTLIAQLLDGLRPDLPLGQLPTVGESRLDQRISLEGIGLVLLALDATQPVHSREREVFDHLVRYQVPTVVCYNKADLADNPQAVLNEAMTWSPAEVIAIAATDRSSLARALTPAVLRLFRGREVRLARRLPIMREAVCRKLIDDTCLANAVYSVGTGLAEIIPALDVPLNVGDMVVLTKNQAIMAYKIALAVGLESDWRKTVPELAAVIGSGFVWRQLGRGLVGLVPVWGIVPKVGVAYAGTFATGQAIYQWCVHGEKLSGAALKKLYGDALERGKQLGRSLVERRKKQSLETAASEEQDEKGQRKPWWRRLSWPRWLALPKPAPRCIQCGKKLPRNAQFCPSCGAAITAALEPPGGEENS